MISRENETRFKWAASATVKPLGKIAPPAAPVPLVHHRLIKEDGNAPIAPVVGQFAEELAARYPGMSAENYPRHGSAGFVGRGYSLDLSIPGRDSRGFYPPNEALKFLRAVHSAAAAVNAEWRVIYNDFSVADAMNRETGRRNVIFVGSVFRKDGRITGLNWHGPDPLILHFHLDLAPRAGALASGGTPPAAPPTTSAPTPIPPVRSSPELVRFAQRVLNAAEGEKLDVDGALGPRTRGALERFRKRHNLGAGGVLDDRTGLALTQRALEELVQQSLFAQPGFRDAQTDQALRNFKVGRGLPANATLDASTRAALADALQRRAAPSVPAPAPEPAAGATDWPRVPTDRRMAHVVNLLVQKVRLSGQRRGRHRWKSVGRVRRAPQPDRGKQRSHANEGAQFPGCLGGLHPRADHESQFLGQAGTETARCRSRAMDEP